MATRQMQIVPLALSLLLATGLPFAVCAQTGVTPDIVFERLDGLSHNTVTSILQDRQGFLWIGTSDGLNRYDGYDFLVYRHDPGDETSLFNNSVKALLEDRLGFLWIGTDGGLNRFDRETGRFVRYPLKSGQQTTRQTFVSHLVEDGEGRLWVGTEEGLYRVDTQTREVEVYLSDANDPNSLESNRISSLYRDRNQTIWVGTIGNVVHRYDPGADRFVRFEGPDTWTYVSIRHDDAQGRLWLAGLGEAVGFDHSENRFTAVAELPTGRTLQAVLDDRRGFIWMGTTDGLFRYNPLTEEHVFVRLDASPGAYLSNYVLTLYQDRAGALWVGALSGLFRLDPHTKPFHHLEHSPIDSNTLSNNTIMAIWEEPEGSLWLGTLGGGLNRIDRKSGDVTRYRSQPHRGALCDDLIWSLFGDRLDRLWIGTDEGLCVRDPLTGQFRRIELPVASRGSRQPPIHAIRGGPGGRIWIGSRSGLYRLDPETGATRWYDRPGAIQVGPFSGLFIQSLHVDKKGALWIGAFGGILYRFDPETDAPGSDSGEGFTHYAVPLDENQELLGEGIWAIHEDAAGRLWLGSDQGLTRFEPATSATRHFTWRDGLPGSIVYTILEDSLGYLWLTTNHGLVRFDTRRPGSGGIRVYDAGDGLQNTEFNRRAAFESTDGTFLLGGLNGLTWFDPAAIQDNPVVPPVVITRMETANRDTTVSVDPHGLESIELSYRDYTFSFAFAALNFTDPAKNRYRYRLEGFDDTWIDAGTTRSARFTNIPPGRYVFHVQGSNNDGRWNETGASLRLTITPPFWHTWWFRALILAGVVGLLTAVYRYRVSRLLEVERMRLRIARDLHDDVGSGLSGIAIASELISRDPNLDADGRRNLVEVTAKARELADALTEIVWLVDPGHDRLDDLLEHMEDVARTMLAGLEYTFDRSQGPFPNRVDLTFRRNLFLLYKEILHNIVKHAGATSVAITLEHADGLLTLSVTDDGVGFDENGEHKGHGLASMSDRAALLGGTLEVQPVPKGGTMVRLVAEVK